MELSEKVKDMVAEKFKIERNKIGSQTNFFAELGADSLEMLSFVTEIETKYSVTIPSQELDNLFCVENIVKFLNANMTNAQ